VCQPHTVPQPEGSLIAYGLITSCRLSSNPLGGINSIRLGAGICAPTVRRGDDHL
jgi:hypothetical protein